jgi:hypothetical protein
MRKKIAEHIGSIIFIALVFIVIFVIWGPARNFSPYKHLNEIKELTGLRFLDLSNPEDRVLLHEALDFIEPERIQEHDSLLSEIRIYMNALLRAEPGSQGVSRQLTIKKTGSLLFMLSQFAWVYVLVLLLATYSVETFAVYRFIRTQQPEGFSDRVKSAWQNLLHHPGWLGKIRGGLAVLKLILKKMAKGLVMLILFAPAYVIAYYFKTRFDTDSVVLMILLGVISNGVLVTYAQKYYTFLTAESRKGYVQTAIVKNLRKDYGFRSKTGIPLSSVFRIRKSFPGHIFGHIYQNVRYQYLNTLKEQASFLITGLIIIEMALNIQGHLCYELMQNILYRNLGIVLMILFGIFLIVKLTEIVIDYLLFLQDQKIGSHL